MRHLLANLCTIQNNFFLLPIGVLEVQEARGDRMCQDALQELKTAIKASGEHKQRILIHIAVDGLKIRDEKTGVNITSLTNRSKTNRSLGSK